MKITKNQLRRIIKEEKQKLQEARASQGGDQRMRAFVDMLQAVEMYAELTSPQNAMDELQILIDDLQAEVDEAEWDEADQDHADRQYAEKHGNPWED